MPDMSSNVGAFATAPDPIQELSSTLSGLSLLPSYTTLDKERDKAHLLALHVFERNAQVAPLTRLPRELLDMILKYVLRPSQIVTIIDGQVARTPAALRVCHALRDPATEIWLSNTKFHLKDRPRLNDEYRWVFAASDMAVFLNCARIGSSRDIFWTFRPRSSWLKSLTVRHRSLIRRLYWNPTRGAQLTGYPDQARLNSVCADLGLREGALYVPYQFGSVGMYFLNSQGDGVGPPVDQYKFCLHEVLGRKLAKGKKVPTTTNGVMLQPYTIRWYTPWGWWQESEQMRRVKRVAVHISKYDWVVAVQYLERYCKVPWADQGKPPPEGGTVGFDLLTAPGTLRGLLGEQS